MLLVGKCQWYSKAEIFLCTSKREIFGTEIVARGNEKINRSSSQPPATSIRLRLSIFTAWLMAPGEVPKIRKSILLLSYKSLFAKFYTCLSTYDHLLSRS